MRETVQTHRVGPVPPQAAGCRLAPGGLATNGACLHPQGNAPGHPVRVSCVIPRIHTALLLSGWHKQSVGAPIHPPASSHMEPRSALGSPPVRYQSACDVRRLNVRSSPTFSSPYLSRRKHTTKMSARTAGSPEHDSKKQKTSVKSECTPRYRAIAPQTIACVANSTQRRSA